jgi:hypothetical protein
MPPWMARGKHSKVDLMPPYHWKGGPLASFPGCRGTRLGVLGVCSDIARVWGVIDGRVCWHGDVYV